MNAMTNKWDVLIAQLKMLDQRYRDVLNLLLDCESREKKPRGLIKKFSGMLVDIEKQMVKLQETHLHKAD